VRCEFGSWKPVSSSRELQLRGQGGQEPLDTDAEDIKVKCRYKLYVQAVNKSDYQSEPRL
jgi:hypothetical protein